jgi:methyl-galactoside transport system substrate-binding protein
LAPKALHSSSNILLTRPINAGVLLYSFDDVFLSFIKKSLEDIEKENKDKIKFTFFDGKSNSAIQSENLDKVIQGNYDFLVLNVYQRRKEVVADVFTKLKQRNIPVILVGSNIPETDAFITVSAESKFNA